MHMPLVAVPEDRVDELVQNGHTRRDAMRQVARENMGAEVREGINDTVMSGTLPGCVRACGACCGALLVLLLFVALLLCAGVCACCGAMHLAGWFLTWWLLGCDHQKELRMWLLLYQVLSLIEACVCSLIRGCVQKIADALDSRMWPGFARFCGVIYSAISFALKVYWCLHVQVLVAAVSAATKPTKHSDEDEEHKCGGILPSFMGWYSCILLLQLLVVEPGLRAGMGLALRAATRGLLQTTRGAKSGTLESMQAVKYDPELFADPVDPGDERPQRECCFCLEEYDEGAQIVKTPCKHLMHQECLGKWLTTSHFCPICRGDLEAPEEEDDDLEEGGDGRGP